MHLRKIRQAVGLWIMLAVLSQVAGTHSQAAIISPKTVWQPTPATVRNALYLSPSQTGGEIGPNDFRISNFGGLGDPAYAAQAPAVAYNPRDNEYLVVWMGSNLEPGVEIFEIFGQRLDASTGAKVGPEGFQISQRPANTLVYAAETPNVVYNSASNEYLVVWWREFLSTSYVSNYDVFGQRLDVQGHEIGINDFRISDMEDIDTFSSFLALKPPGLVYNPTENEYFVVWFGEDNVDGMADMELEVFGQRLDGATAAEVDAHNFRISDMGGLGNGDYSAWHPDVAWNSIRNEYLVVWNAEDDNDGMVLNEFEIFGQRLNAATGAEVGANDFRISDMGGSGNTVYGAGSAEVVFNAANNEYLVVWNGEDNVGGLADGEFEIFGQRLQGATGAEVGANDFRISDMGGTGDPAFSAKTPAVAYDPDLNQYLVVWWGDDNVSPLVQDEDEIFGQRLNAATGAAIFDNDFRLSDMGPDGDTDYAAYEPVAIYNPQQREYLVLWSGSDDMDGQVADEFEIFGQRYTSNTPAPTGTPTTTSTPSPTVTPTETPTITPPPKPLSIWMPLIHQP
ncbi:MAG: hypothetical protein J5I90_07945 [Caldilineales bacterium]|nr:hypothetical protein [Caldilineales bacterium]